MLQAIESEKGWTLSNYAVDSRLAAAVRTLQVEASIVVPQLRDRTIWMVNSTAQGGGVAEMLPRMAALLEELGLRVKWVVMGTDRPEFFKVTKQLHNLIHGEGNPELSAKHREVYEFVNRKNAEEFAPQVRPDDIVVIHDPQPLAMGAMLKRQLGVRTIWRCHIGLDERTPATRAAWSFLKPWAESYDLAIFSSPEYIPDYMAGRATIIHPALDPRSHKNRELPPHKLVGILCNGGLQHERHPVVTPPFSVRAQRLRPDGSFAPATDQEEIGLPYRPLVCQISRWDRLKGFKPLLEGFVRLKQSLDHPNQNRSARHRRQLELARLVLAGPDPASIQDDPEGEEVLADLCAAYRSLPPGLQQDVALTWLPMASRKENALMVNALQRCSTVVVQNSLREGFGLTATEAMWKGVCVVGTRACGLRHQIRSGIDGVVIQDPQDPNEIARRLDDILQNARKREYMARNAHQRVHQEFLIFKQLCDWLRELSTCAMAPPRMEDCEEEEA
jgi:trehalose synthase